MNSYWRDFEKVDEGRNLRSQLWVCMTRYRNYIYIFPIQFEQSTVAMYGGISKIYIIYIGFYLFFILNEKVRGTKTEKSDVATYGVIIHVSIYFFGYDYLANVSSLDCRQYARVSVKREYVWREKSYISSTVMHLDYILYY